MTTYKITPANSVTVTADYVNAFDGDTAKADTLIVDADSYLFAKGENASGANLANTQAWKVQTNGYIGSEKFVGLYLNGGNPQISSISVGAAGEIYGGLTGIHSLSAASITNAGYIRGVGTAVYAEGPGAGLTVKNTGTIQGTTYAIASGVAADKVTNSGEFKGIVDLGGGNDSLTNTRTVSNAVVMGGGQDQVTNSKTGTIASYVDLGAGDDKLTNSGSILGMVLGGEGNDVVKNSGTIGGLVDLGVGNDSFTGGNGVEKVVDGMGADKINLGGGNDVYFGAGGFDQSYDGLDTIDGGAGGDTYDASNSTQDFLINLDTVAHDAGPFLPGSGYTTAGIAYSESGLQVDKIKNFEVAKGGAGNDYIYGHGGNNLLEGNAGADKLFGFGGADVLYGGSGLDVLVGGAGKDYLNGGAGADFFVFTAVSDSGVTAATRDVIEDFTILTDVIDLRWIDANTRNGAADDAFSFIGFNSFNGTAGQLRVYSMGDTQFVEGDVNGDGKADFSIEVYTAPTALLTASDFLL